MRDSRLSEAGSDVRDHIIGSAVRVTQHALDALLSRGHDRQAVAPSPLTEELIELLEIVGHFGERGPI
jgi:hypothetical protein